MVESEGGGLVGVSLSKGKLVEESFISMVFPSIVEKPVKTLGRWYNSTLSDRGQVEEPRESIVILSIPLRFCYT